MDMRVLQRKVYSRIENLFNSWENEYTPKIGRYHPSGIGGCLRQSYYKYLIDVPPKIRAKGRIVWSRIMESFIQDVLKSSGFEIEVHFEKQLTDSITISGRVDAINDTTVVEIKTVTPTQWAHIPRQIHINQLNTYMWLSDRETGVLWYLKSDNPAFMKWYVYKYDPALQERLNAWVLKLHGYLTRGELPPARIGPKCRTCVFKKLCERGYNPAQRHPQEDK